MILLRQIRADIKQGIQLKWFFFFLIVIVSIVLTSLFLYHNNGLVEKGRLKGNISLGDVFYYMFRGMQEYRPEKKEPFVIADSFLIWSLLLALLIGHYPVKEFKNTGKNYLVRAKTRIDWWLSKCVWNCLSVFLFYACIFVGMIIATFLCSIFMNHVSGGSLNFNEDLFFRIFRTRLDPSLQGYICVQIFLLPIAASLALSMLQMALSFIINAPIGYVMVIVVCGFSAYYMKWFLVGNSMMVFRYQAVNPNGIGIALPLLASVLQFLISGICGYIYFRNQDIL